MGDPDWKAALQAVAPAIATALGGPLAGLAATVVGRTLLGREQEATTTMQEAQEAVARAVATPEGLARLKEAEAKLLELSSQLTIRLEEVSAGDRASARAMAQEDRWTPRMLAAGVFLGWLGLNSAVFAFGMPTGAGELLSRALGGLDALMAAVFAFYFGSSAGSKAKTEAMAAVAARR